MSAPHWSVRVGLRPEQSLSRDRLEVVAEAMQATGCELAVSPQGEWLVTLDLTARDRVRAIERGVTVTHMVLERQHVDANVRTVEARMLDAVSAS